MFQNLLVGLIFFTSVLGVGVLGGMIDRYTGIITKLAVFLEGSHNERD